MEKYQNFDDAILGLQNEVNKYKNIPSINSNGNQTINPKNDEINILSSKSIPKINSKKLLIAFPILLFFALIYFQPEFIMRNRPQDKEGKKIDYGKVIITVSVISFLMYIITNSG